MAVSLTSPADLLRAELASAQNRGGDAPQLLLRAAKKLETLDVRLSRGTYRMRYSFSGNSAVTKGTAYEIITIRRVIR